MFWERYTGKVDYLYHFTTKENCTKILKEKAIRCFDDDYVFFAKSLEESRMLFKKINDKGATYIDKNLQLQHSDKVNEDDYVILKIRNQGRPPLYRFNISHPENVFCSYDYSVSCKGNYRFDRAEIIPMKSDDLSDMCSVASFENKKSPSRIKKLIAIAACTATFVLQTATFAFAGTESWISNSAYYDISWYDAASDSYSISDSADLAGLLYLVNNGSVFFNGKTINITNDIDMTAHSWNTLSDSFSGAIEGAHRILLSHNDFTNSIGFKGTGGSIATNNTIIEYQADYSAVDTALSHIPTDLSKYTKKSVATLKRAQSAVLRDKDTSQQSVVDAYAASIETAINNLVLKDAKGYDAIATSPDTSDPFPMGTVVLLSAVSLMGFVTFIIIRPVQKRRQN